MRKYHTKKRNQRYIDNYNGEITINGLRYNACILGKNRCDDCKRVIMHSYDHDAYFCPVCDKWLDSACSDPECRFCKNRPKFPLMSGKETNKLNDLINNKIMKRKERARKKFERKYNKG